jgi:hypothetical protein
MSAPSTAGRPPTGQGDLRQIADGDTIPAAVLRDFLLTCLRHDALGDMVLERLDRLAGGGNSTSRGSRACCPNCTPSCSVSYGPPTGSTWRAP